MTTVHVVAFDPGVTTGWCVMGVHPIHLTPIGTPSLHSAIHDAGEWSYGQIDAGALGSPHGGVGVGRGHDALNFPGENMAVEQMLDLVIWKHPQSVVLLEKFVIDPSVVKGNFNFVAPVRIISAFSYGLHDFAMCWPDKQREIRDPYNRFNLINRGDPKRTCTDERLTHWGFGDVVSHRTRHAADATRIAYYFLRGCRGNSFKAREARWRAWPHVFSDPAISEIEKAYPKKPKSLGERI